MSDIRPILSKNAHALLEQRYLHRDDDRQIIESPHDMYVRIADWISNAELEYGDKKQKDEYFWKFLDALLNLEIVPASPYMFNCGVKNAGLFSCFVVPIGDSIEEIYKCITDCAKIYQATGGIGVDMSPIREEGAIVRRSKGYATGPLSFLGVMNSSAYAVNHGGHRRAASLVALDIDHPDIEKFIEAKSKNLPEITALRDIILRSSDKVLVNFAKNELDKLQQFTLFNFSVKITDKFLQAVANDDDWNLISRLDGKVTKVIKAKKLFRDIVKNAWRSAEPGIIFIDNVNKDNTLPGVGRIECCNPCNSKDNIVLTQQGYRRIKDIIGNNTIDVVYNGNTYKHRGFLCTGKNKQLYKIIFSNGQESKFTSNHKIVLANGTEKEVKDLCIGDKIEHHVYNIHQDYNIDDMNEYECGVLAGWWFGDGTLYYNNSQKMYRYSLATGEHEIDCQTILDKYIDKHVGGKSKWLRIGTKKCFRKSLKNSFRNIILCDNKDDFDILNRSKSFKIGFLRGIFTSDGSPRKGCAELYFSDRLNVYRDIQLVLYEFGIYNTITKHANQKRYIAKDGKIRNNKDSYKICIYEWDIFAKYIGFLSESKQQYIQSHSMLSSRKIISVKNIIPDFAIEDVYNTIVENVHRYIVSCCGTCNCGEQYLQPYQACNLVTINLNKAVKGSCIDWDNLDCLARLATRFSDDAIDVSGYPLPEIEKAVKDSRRIGIGIMGLADVLIKMRLPYDSEEARNLAKQIMQFIRNSCIEESKKLAKERGAFGLWPKSIWAQQNIKVRNCAFTSIQPNGSTSIIAGASASAEPLFNVYYIRRTGDGKEIVEIHESFVEDIKKAGLNIDEIVKKLEQVGSIQNIVEIPEEIKKIYKCAQDISPEAHTLMQSVLQQFVDGGISKTINLAADVTENDVAIVYQLAWEKGCKGVTVYREGCRNSVLSTKSANVDDYERKLANFLYDKYNKQELSCREIADLLNVSVTTVFTRLKKYGIKRRSIQDIRDSKNKKLSPLLINVIYGNLLGTSKVFRVQQQGSYRHITKHFDYANHVRDLFVDQGIACTDIMTIHTDDIYFYFDTEFLNELAPIEIMFFENEGVRILPDISLTPEILKYYYLSEGTKTDKGGIKLERCCVGLQKKIAKAANIEIIEKGIESAYIPKKYVDVFYSYIEQGQTSISEEKCPECGTLLEYKEHCKSCPKCGWSACSI